jgi:putative chitinase
MKVTAHDVVLKFAPNARPAYKQAFLEGDALLAEHDIDTPKRLAHFLAQVFHESGGLRVERENGRYSAKNLAKMWDDGNWHKWFNNDRAACIAMAPQCAADGGRALFNRVYGKRMGNRGADTDDGWTYRGHGLLQTTGREAYVKYGKRWGVDFAGQPELILDPAHALKPALSEWSDKGCNSKADQGDIVAITKAINGGSVGLPERKAWYAKIFPWIQAGLPIQWRVQAALQKAGLLDEDPDGVVGQNTRGAISAFRAARGLPGGTAIDAALIAALGLEGDDD